MKILHLISSFCFSDNKSLYDYVFTPKCSEIDSKVHIFSSSLRKVENNYKKFLQKISFYKPDIIHFHGIESLVFLDFLKDSTFVAFILSLYRFESLSILNKYDLSFFKLFFIPYESFLSKENLYFMSSIAIIKETLLNISHVDVCKPCVNNFGIIFNVCKDSVDNLHLSIKNILDTNRQINITWIVMNKSDKNLILNSCLYSSINNNIFIEEYSNIRMENFTGFIIDNEFFYKKNRNDFLSFFLKCMSAGRIILIDSLQNIDDLFIENFNALLFESYNYSSLTHILHFLISFKDVELKLSQNSENFFYDNHSTQNNLISLKDGYKKALKNNVIND